MTKKFRTRRYTLTNDSVITMGILNVTPDSFSDGGVFFDEEPAVEQVYRMIEDGAGIIDIGGQSTRPGSRKIDEKEEWQRISKVLCAIDGKVNVPVSVDTFYPYVARRALENGADIINDVGGVIDPQTADAVREYGAGWIITDVSSRIGSDPAGITAQNLEKMADDAEKSGVNTEQICIDPGFGFGLDSTANCRLLYGSEKISAKKYFTLSGMSRKRFVGALSGIEDPKMRDDASVVLAVYAAAMGADIIRVHNVKKTVSALRIINNMKKEI